jgi:2-oxoglutarate ferredoxin oxidoreductase subunit beta
MCIRDRMIAKSKGEILTGLLYMSPNTVDLHNTIQTNDRALNSLTKKDLCPGNEILKTINAEFR